MPESAAPAGARLRFNEAERRHLLASPRLGPTVVQRLEQSGIASIETLRALGVDRVVEALCQQGHNRAWMNRRRALLRAIEDFSN
jgi:hypothetical protein